MLETLDTYKSLALDALDAGLALATLETGLAPSLRDPGPALEMRCALDLGLDVLGRPLGVCAR